MPKGDRPNRFKIIPKEDVEKEIALGKEMKPSVFHPIKDMTGEKFADENVIVLGRYKENTADQKAQWICKCNLCGRAFYTTGKNLRNGSTRSCGCLVSKKCAERNRKVPLTDSELGRKIYQVYTDIVRKCYDTNRRDYTYAGAKGVYIDPEWYTPDDPNNIGFVNFYNWMVDNGYTNENRLLVWRIDKTGPYSTKNCKLVTNPARSTNQIEDALHFDDERGEYVDINGFIRLIDKREYHERS